MYLLYFGLTFVLVPWWTHTDPLRPSRLSVGATLTTALAALVVPFPQPWGLTIAVAGCVAAQLGATWLSPEDRAEIEAHWRTRQQQRDTE
jgi:hypothetical protein